MRPFKLPQALVAGVSLDAGNSCLFSGKPSGIHTVPKCVLARGGGGGTQAAEDAVPLKSGRLQAQQQSARNWHYDTEENIGRK